MGVWAQMQSDLAALEHQGLRRSAFVADSPAQAYIKVAGLDMVCLCSDNYLDLANHPEVRGAAAQAVARWGVGTGASRLVGGTTPLHIDLQDALAQFHGCQGAVVTATAWQACTCALGPLASSGDLMLADASSRPGILDAARNSGAVFRTYQHNDMDNLRALLVRIRSAHNRCIFVTDGLFGMDGDVAPLKELVEIKNRYDGVLVVDESHAAGLLGAGGRGAAEAAGVADEVDVTIGTLGMALGSFGGFVAGPRALMEMVFNSARPFGQTMALPPAMCAAALAAMEIVRREPERRKTCLRNADRLRGVLAERGLNIGSSVAHIIPIILGPPQQTLALSRRCFEAAFLAPAIRPPSVQPGTSRLRVSVTSAHEWNDLRRFADLLCREKAEG